MAVILFDVPAFIWYGWLEVLYEDEVCGQGEMPDQYDIWEQPLLGMLFLITFYFLWDFYSAIVLSFLECYQVKHGLSEANCLTFTIG